MVIVMESPMDVAEEIITSIRLPTESPPVYWGLMHGREAPQHSGEVYPIPLLKNERVLLICKQLCPLSIQNVSLEILTGMYSFGGADLLNFLINTKLPPGSVFKSNKPMVDLEDIAQQTCVYENFAPPLFLAFGDPAERRLGVYIPPVDFIFNPGKKLFEFGDLSTAASIEPEDIVYENDYLFISPDSQLVTPDDADGTGQIPLQKIIENARNESQGRGFTLVLFSCRSPTVDEPIAAAFRTEQQVQKLGDWWNTTGMNLYDQKVVIIKVDQHDKELVVTLEQLRQAFSQEFPMLFDPITKRLIRIDPQHIKTLCPTLLDYSPFSRDILKRCKAVGALQN